MTSLHPSSLSERIRNVTFIGNRGVGKTAITRVFSEGVFPQEYRPNMDRFTEGYVTHNNVRYTIKLYDTAGWDLHTNFLPPGIDGNTDAFVLVYSVVDQSTFDHLLTHYKLLDINGLGNIPRLIVGNKVDLPERIVPAESGSALAAKLNSKYMECSALNPRDVSQVFITLLKMIEPNTDESNFTCCIL
ncbi:hypothetical protein RCL1_003193 [Eukaryota sp. TZLM3-RCL]